MLISKWLQSTLRQFFVSSGVRSSSPRSRRQQARDELSVRSASIERLEDRALLTLFNVMPYTISSNPSFEIVGGFIETDGTTGTNLTIGGNITDYAVTTTNGTDSQTFIPSNSNIVNSSGIDISAATTSIPGGAQNSFMEIGDNAPNRAIWFHNLGGGMPFPGPSVLQQRPGI